MVWTLLLLWLIVWLLLWTFITIGSTPANISNLLIHVLNGLLSLGVVCALFVTTVLAVKMLLWDTIPLLDQTYQPYSVKATKSKS